MKHKIPKLIGILLSLVMLSTMYAPQASVFADDTTAAEAGIAEEAQPETLAETETETEPASEQKGPLMLRGPCRL